MSALAVPAPVATVERVSAASPTDEPGPTPDDPAGPELQLVGQPKPVDRRRRLSSALLVLGVVLLAVAVYLAR